MTEIIGVRFKSGGKQYYFDPKGAPVAEGQGVIVETASGTEYGECVQPNTMVEDSAVVQPLRALVRLATEKDLAQVEKNREKEKRAFQICQQKIAEHGLEMKLVEVEYNFEGSKILFFFTSEGRVDFRGLVKDLAGVFHTRIELRQIGVRDEAKMLGGLGICGKPFCCSTFLGEFQPVSIKMAKTQNLSLNPTKISGTCGRLMCCLKYEQGGHGEPGGPAAGDREGPAGGLQRSPPVLPQLRDLRGPQRQGQAARGLCGPAAGGAGEAAQGDPAPRRGGPAPPQRPGGRPGPAGGGVPGGRRAAGGEARPQPPGPETLRPKAGPLQGEGQAQRGEIPQGGGNRSLQN